MSEKSTISLENLKGKRFLDVAECPCGNEKICYQFCGGLDCICDCEIHPPDVINTSIVKELTGSDPLIVRKLLGITKK